MGWGRSLVLLGMSGLRAIRTLSLKYLDKWMPCSGSLKMAGSEVNQIVTCLQKDALVALPLEFECPRSYR